MYKRQIATFIQVADSGSFAKASEQLFVSTVSVMKQINSLEAEIGVKLLDRTNQGVRLTPAGQSLYKDAKEIILMSKQAISHARELANVEKYTIRIGSSKLRSHNIIMERWAEIDDGSLPFEIRIIPFSDETTDLNTALGLIGKDFDCFATPCDLINWEGKYNMEILKSAPYCLAVPRKHKFAQKPILTWNDLYGETLMLMKRGLFAQIDALRDEIERFPEIKIIDVPRSYDYTIFNECAQKNYLLGSLDIWTDIHPSLIIKPVEWANESQYGIVYEKDASKIMKEFIKVISK